MKVGNASTSSNSNGSITSTVQANDTAGISIVQYAGTGSAATIGHGLTTAPDVIWVKNLTDAGVDWRAYWHGGNRASQSNPINETDAVELCNRSG